MLRVSVVEFEQRTTYFGLLWASWYVKTSLTLNDLMYNVMEGVVCKNTNF